MGEREVTLGSLREAEGLFRQAKRRAQEIVTWWEQAETSIREAEELLTGQSGATIDNLRQIIRDARNNSIVKRRRRRSNWLVSFLFNFKQMVMRKNVQSKSE